jgi:hypothetical protein
MTTTLNDDMTTCRRWAEFFRLRGFNPLPSDPTPHAEGGRKKPLCRYADLWETPASPDLFDRFPTTNVQVMTGRHWRLLVIDLDGPEAPERFKRMGRTPRTWATHSGGNGVHLWFMLAPGIERELPKAFLWKGEESHSAIERLCDRSLVMAPPSIHPKTGNRYRFRSSWESPEKLPMPAACPAWILEAKPIESAPKIKPMRRDAADLIGSIPHKVDIARSWGVRFTGRPTQKGWWPCHAIDREDRTASAAVHQDSGFYVDQGSGERLSFIDLGIRMGAFMDFKDAMTRLGVKHAG